MPGSDLPWRVTSSGVVLRFRLTPKASADAVEGIETSSEGPAIKARVRAQPSDGAANAALSKLVAKWLGVPKSHVLLISGGKSRIKSLAISGQPDVLSRSIAAKLGN